MTGTLDVAPGGLDHVGFVYSSPDALVEGVLPRVRATLADGGRVAAVLERATERRLLEILGPGAGIEFTPASAVRRPAPGAFLDRVRDTAGPRRGLVVAQYSVFEASDVDLRHGEDEINRTLADLPVTLVCACAADTRLTRLSTAHAVHPRLLRDGRVEDNTDYRAEGETLDVARDGDVHLLGLTFRDTGDLRRVRAAVSAVVTNAALRAEDVRASVFAVHEAATLVAEHAEHGTHDTGGTNGTGDAGTTVVDPCALDVWSTPTGTIAVEVRGPRRPRRTGELELGRLWRDPDRRPDPLAYVRLFCRDAVTIEAGDTRIIRILTPTAR